MVASSVVAYPLKLAAVRNLVHSELANGYTVRLMESRGLQTIEDMNQVVRIQVNEGTCSIDREGTTKAYINLLEDNLVAMIKDVEVKL